MTNEPQALVLCEDVVHHHFIKKYLEFRGIHPRKIHVISSPKARGSGKQFVFKHYANVVKSFRSKEKHLNLILIVMFDADQIERSKDLKDLEKNLEEKRTPKEKVAIFIPARNIETWFYFLEGNQDINENKTYKEYFKRAVKPSFYAEKLAKEICPQGLPEYAPPSLEHACSELERLRLKH